MTAPRERPSWLGVSLPRLEDARFLTGSSQYTDDIVLPGMLHAAMLRSPYAHALITRIDCSAALSMPGVHGMITGADLVGRIEPGRGSTYPAGGEWYYLATDRVRFAGDPVAIVAAEDRYLAEDALEAIQVDYEPLPAVLDPERAADPDQPVLHPGAPGGNEVFNQVWDYGDVDAAFAEAEVVVRERLVVHRHSAMPLEGLVAIANYDAVTGEITIWANIGNLGRFTEATKALKVDHADVRLIVPDVGGSFGLKAWVHQRAVLLAVLSQKVGRPVKWTEDRIEHFIASHHGTGRIADVELAARRDGTILGMKVHTLDDQGAYVCITEPHGPRLMLATVAGPYRFQNVRVAARCVVTNRCPVASNRGYGRVQPVFALERMVDRLARELRLDPLDLRIKNAIPREAYPYLTPTGSLYDSGDPAAILRQVRELLDYDQARAQQTAAREDGRLLGIGLAMSVEGGGPSPYDVASVMLGPDGRLMVQAPTLAQGQGHETTIAQIVAEQFDVDPRSIHVTVRLDSRTMPYTTVSGTYASKFSATGAPAVHGAARKLAEQLAALVAEMLDADPREIVFRDGSLVVPGSDRRLSLREIGQIANDAPARFGLGANVALQATYFWQWPHTQRGGRGGSATFTVVGHGAVVEVDAETGQVSILRYVSSEDCGRIINPMIVRGQITGGLINGLGWALTEKLVYDDAGQLVTATFMDYMLPRFSDIPPLRMGHIECPTPFSPLGAKGVGEGGAIPPIACIANAVEDAIVHLGGVITESHLTPEYVLRAIRSGGAR